MRKTYIIVLLFMSVIKVNAQDDSIRLSTKDHLIVKLFYLNNSTKIGKVSNIDILNKALVLCEKDSISHIMIWPLIQEKKSKRLRPVINRVARLIDYLSNNSCIHVPITVGYYSILSDYRERESSVVLKFYKY